MRIDESQIESARIIEQVNRLGSEEQVDAKEIFRLALFLIFITCLRDRYREDELLEEGELRSFLRYNWETIEKALTITPEIYKDHRFKALEELFYAITKYDQRYFANSEPSFPVVSRRSVAYLVELVLRNSNEKSPAGVGSLNAVFDGVFRYYLEKFGGVDENRVDALSIIASTLFGEHLEQIIDYFPFSAEPLVQSSKVLGFAPVLISGSTINNFYFEYWMRSLIYGAEIKRLDENMSSSDVFSVNSVGLVDAACAPSKNNEFWFKEYNQPSKEKGVPAWFISELVRGEKSPEYSVLSVPAADISRGGRFSKLMENLVIRGNVVAVVDLPLGKKEKIRWSIWVLKHERVMKYRSLDDNILFVAPDALKNLSLREERDQVFVFVSLVVKQFLHRVPSTDLEEKLRGSFLELFLKNFSEGYRDVEGLCNLLSIDEVLRSGSRLAARNFVESMATDHYIPGLDTNVLQDAIKSSQGGGCFFLIGDNGEGKSITLSKLADFYYKNERKTLAVSFGAMDRFRYDRRRSQEYGLYSYLGGRTSQGGTRSKDLSSEIAFRLVDGQNGFRSQFFIDLAKRIGFSADYFLIPHLTGSSEFSPNKNIGHVIRIFSGDVQDERLLDEYKREGRHAKRLYQLGLKRDSDRNIIVPFKELSSGEQQILNLISRLIFNVEEGCICFIDEPEISLHVSWQRAIPKLLRDIASSFRCDIVVATHSPILISEAVQQGSMCFSSKSRVIKRIESVEQNSIESVIFECFETNTVNNREVHERCASILSKAIKYKNGFISLRSGGQQLIDELDKMEEVIVRTRYGSGDESVRELDIIKKTKQAILDVLGYSVEGARNFDD